MKNKLAIAAMAAAALVMSFTATARAAAAVEPSDGSVLDLLQPLLEAFKSGRYAYAGSIVLVVAVALTRKYLGDRVAWLHTDRGSATLTVAGSFGATLAVRLAAPSAVLTSSMAWDALVIAAIAAGGYAMIKKLVVEPLLGPLVAKYPTYAAPLKLILWFFDHPPAPPAPLRSVP